MKASAKKTLIGIAGGVVLLAGIALIFLPGPAFIVIPAGLAILSTEFEWAHRLKEKTKDWIERTRERRHTRGRTKPA